MIGYEKEDFPCRPDKAEEFRSLWDAHGIEVKGKPLCLSFSGYARIEDDGRLIWIVARDEGVPVGYSCHWWYQSLHFDQRVGHDDLWFVAPSHRGRGIGRNVKKIGHAELRMAGAVETEDMIRISYEHPRLMSGLGFEVRGTWWMKKL